MCNPSAVQTISMAQLFQFLATVRNRCSLLLLDRDRYTKFDTTSVCIIKALILSISLGVPSPGEARVQALAILRVLGGFRRSMGNIVHDYLMRNLIFLKFTIITNGLLFLSIGDPDLNLDPRCRARKSLRNHRWASLAKIMTKCELSESQ